MCKLRDLVQWFLDSVWQSSVVIVAETTGFQIRCGTFSAYFPSRSGLLIRSS